LTTAPARPMLIHVLRQSEPKANLVSSIPKSIDETIGMLAEVGYLASRPLATVVFLALNLGRPLFLEGEAGVGKTEIAKAIATALGRRLIRLQCYEGLDAASAVCDWNFAAQMIAIRTAEASGSTDRTALRAELFSEDYLIERPLLAAMRPQPGGAPVLLIDELDRTDEPFEAFLLEALSDFQVTIPELGTIRAPQPPIVILTSNRTREVHDALKRRCLYHWVDYPGFEREMAIVEARAPEASRALTREIVGFVQALRGEDLFKRPGLAETIDWAKCLLALDVVALSPEVIADTLGAILKYQDDIQKIQGSEAKRILDRLKTELNTNPMAGADGPG
jgi:MoxR-like ATPase